MKYDDLIDKLLEKDVVFEDGLNENEIKYIEALYEIEFPVDLKEFLMTALPVSKGFVKWRDYSEENIEKIRSSLDWPLEGMIFDIEENNFWYEEWGERAESLEEAINKCKEEMNKVPKMIPIYSHRYIPSEPLDAGNPIFSIYQTDIIYYGENIESYMDIEFGIKNYEDMDWDRIRKIRFWEDLQS